MTTITKTITPTMIKMGKEQPRQPRFLGVVTNRSPYLSGS
jgi:hypothetical protein